MLFYFVHMFGDRVGFESAPRPPDFSLLRNALQFADSCCFVERKTAVTIVFLPSQTPHTWALTQSETALSQHKHVCACVCLSAIPAKTSYSFLVLAL